MSEQLDPQVRAVIEEIQAMGVPEWHAMSVESARRVEDEVFASGSGQPPVETVRDLAFDGPDGEVPLRVYSPDADGPAPVLVYFHGGGWMLGTLDGVDDICRELATRVGAVVVSVDYRLAPEHPFPEPLADAYAAIEWATAHADAFGGDPERVGVGGTSAGGNLAAAVALLAREHDGPDLAAQLLCYPITNHDFDTDSYAENASDYLLTRADMEWFWDQYLRSDVDGHNPFASPLRARDLSGLPPATVVTAGFDPLRDEGAAYADRLAMAGVPVEHLDYERLCHGFLSMTDAVDAAADAMGEVTASVRETLSG
jgi:acetyl esterase